MNEFHQALNAILTYLSIMTSPVHLTSFNYKLFLSSRPRIPYLHSNQEVHFNGIMSHNHSWHRKYRHTPLINVFSIAIMKGVSSFLFLEAYSKFNPMSRPLKLFGFLWLSQLHCHLSPLNPDFSQTNENATEPLSLAQTNFNLKWYYLVL